MLRHVTRVSALCLTFALAACDESLSSLTGPTPQLKPTFSSIQTEIFENGDSSGRPACISCHNAAGQFFNGLNLTHAVAYANLVNVASRGKPSAIRVVPGEPDNSYLVHKLEGGPALVGQRMPLNGPYLIAGQIDVIRRWIEEGAANN
jgi:hypothetical protein